MGCSRDAHSRDFYPRSPCGERQNRNPTSHTNLPFLSTLSLRRATDILAHLAQHLIFLSTLSLRRATLLLVGLTLTSPDFYPRSPCGERHIVVESVRYDYEFLSTLSLRRATNTISSRIHRGQHFYPRSPCGERRNTHNSAETT